MLKLNASYSKKVPVPGQDFSSQSYHASVECELADGLSPDALQDRIHSVFDIVRQSVESELNGRHDSSERVSGEQENPKRLKQEPKNSPDPRPKQSPGHADERATTKQLKFITDLANRRNLSLDELEGEVARLFHAHSIYDLTRKQASQLVDRLRAA